MVIWLDKLADGVQHPAMDDLAVRDVSKDFGGVHALRGVSLNVVPTEILGLIGPNGSGKTTLLNVVSGVYAPVSGSVVLGDVLLSGQPPHRIVASGVARTFQNIRLFGDLSALENVETGAVVGQRRGGGEPRTTAWRLLEHYGLLAYAMSRTHSLPYGVQRRLEMARALATRPSYLLLDEPAAGMNEEESDGLLAAIRALRDESDVGVVVIDHDLRLITRLCDRVVVLNDGTKIADGSAREVTRDQAVIDAYLGKRASRRKGHVET